MNNINQASYYRWLKRIRETIIESSESHSNEIVEIRSNSLPAPSINPVIAVVVSKGDSRIEISSDCPEWMIKTILGNLC
ncbi:MAG: hypothetical protein Q4B84_05450 [Clostridia bacterium]|nr:hypothetical protein [Clostridia bacterium]